MMITTTVGRMLKGTIVTIIFGRELKGMIIIGGRILRGVIVSSGSGRPINRWVNVGATNINIYNTVIVFSSKIGTTIFSIV